MGSQPSLRVRYVNVGTPDVAALREFYRRLLGWEVEQDEGEFATLRDPDGGTGLAFQQEDGYVPPSWPAGPGEQQMMLHLEIEVDDLAAATEHALACGGRLAGFQPQEDVRVVLDPDGHPFCLYL